MGRSPIALMTRLAPMAMTRKSNAYFLILMNDKVLSEHRNWPSIIMLFLVMMLSGGNHLFIRNPICLLVIVVYGVRIYKLLGGLTLQCIPQADMVFLCSVLMRYCTASHNLEHIRQCRHSSIVKYHCWNDCLCLL